MSQGCNFINSLMSASRRRASSVTPSDKTTSATVNGSTASSSSSSSATNIDRSKINSGKNKTTNVSEGKTVEIVLLRPAIGRRASSSNDIPDSIITDNNHLTIGASTETICPDDATQTGNKPTAVPSKHVEGTPIHHSPLQVDIDSPLDGGNEAIFQELGYAEEATEFYEFHEEDFCRELESEIEEWERKVDELERRRFRDDVPRTLVESIVSQKRELRKLEHELYIRQLDSENSDELSENASYLTSPMAEEVAMIPDSSPENHSQYYPHHQHAHLQYQYQLQQPHYTQDSPTSDNHAMNQELYESNHHHHHHKNQQIYLLRDEETEQRLVASKFGSNIKPGQENTADILEAIPPTGSLQYKQYLARASSGTDSSEYGRLPSFEHHTHQLPPLSSARHSPQLHHNQNQRSPRHNSRHRQHQHQADQIYVQLSRSPLSSPRPPRETSGQNENNRSQPASGGERKVSTGNRVSPVRPNHFKDEFWPPNRVFGQDSSSTASSSSPHWSAIYRFFRDVVKCNTMQYFIPIIVQ